MGSATVKKIDGFLAVGGEIPFINPHDLVIVGLDVEETTENWFAHCARIGDISDEEILAYAESILAAGKVDHVVKAYRDGETSLVLLDGRTTTRAARMARDLQAKRKVPEDERIGVRVNILRGDKDELYRVNLDSHKHRPLTRTQHAKGVLTYFTQAKEDYAKTAAFFKVDVATVKTMLAHFDLSAAAQKAIDEKQVPATVTKKLAKLPRAEQDKVLSEMQAVGATKGASAENALKKAAKGEKIEKADHKKMLRRPVLEKWSAGLRKIGDYSDMVDLLNFILGVGPLPKMKDDAVELLLSAGWRDPNKKKVEKKSRKKAAA